MRMFDLFVRRRHHAVSGASLPARRRAAVSRLSFQCATDVLNDVRRQIYVDFEAAGLSVSQVRVDASRKAAWVSACITVDCPPELRGAFMNQARRLSAHPAIEGVRFGDTLAAVTA